jgi:hypothetical protein
MREQLAHPPYGTRRFADAPPPVRVGVAGSGSGLLVLAWSAAALARERVAGTRLLRRLGIRPGMRVANVLPGALATPGSLLLGDVIEELGGLDVPLGAVDAAPAARQAWELLVRVQPEVLIVDEAAAGPLFAEAPADLVWWRGLVWLRGAAALHCVPAPAAFVGWERTWLAVPEATSFVAGSCAAACFHVDEGVVAEVVDEATGAVRPSPEEGTLALSPLGGDVPLLRYASGVRARALPEPCACGARGAILEIP